MILTRGLGVGGGLAIAGYGASVGTAEHSRRTEEYRGGRKQDDAIHLEHWEYIDALREIQVRVADDVRGERMVSIPLDMRIPDTALPPAMRGRLTAPRAADVIHDPMMLAVLVFLIDEESDY